MLATVLATVLLMHIKRRANFRPPCTSPSPAPPTQGTTAIDNGRYMYAETVHVCNSKPVYQKGGSDGWVLYQPSGYSDWRVGSSDRATDCENTDVLQSDGNGGVCPDSPDGAGCAGKWWEESVQVSPTRYLGGSNPSIAVDAARACVGSPCGSHSTSCVADGTDQHVCTCEVGWWGATCDQTMAAAYIDMYGLTIPAPLLLAAMAGTPRPRTSAAASRSTRRAGAAPSGSSGWNVGTRPCTPRAARPPPATGNRVSSYATAASARIARTALAARGSGCRTPNISPTRASPSSLRTGGNNVGSQGQCDMIKLDGTRSVWGAKRAVEGSSRGRLMCIHLAAPMQPC